MKNKCTVIQISGLRGLLIVGFIIMCAIAGFIVFPSWCCMKAWNLLAGFVNNMPLMELKHGAILWLILILASYATLFNKFKISFVPRTDCDIPEENYKDSVDIIRSLEKKDLNASKTQDREEIKK